VHLQFANNAVHPDQPSALATLVNSSLDVLNLPQFMHSVPTEQGRFDIEFDDEVFIHTAPPRSGV
jgi:hypothetical protein